MTGHADAGLPARMPSDLSDVELVERCRSGDHDAWCELVERFSRYVYAIATRAYRLDDRDAEDVFQEVFERAYEHLGRLRDPSALRPWIAQLTRRTAVDRLRSASRESKAVDASDLETEYVDDALTRIEEAVVVRTALARLPEHSQEILDRFFARDESYRTIGDALGLPAGTIASRISRGLAMLRSELQEG